MSLLLEVIKDIACTCIDIWFY